MAKFLWAHYVFVVFVGEHWPCRKNRSTEQVWAFQPPTATVFRRPNVCATTYHYTSGRSGFCCCRTATVEQSPSRTTTTWPLPRTIPSGAKASSCQEYISARTAVVRSPWLIRPSGTHSATICAIQISVSPSSVAYWRHICFSSRPTRCIKHIRDTVR